jgi:hypothetical protein
VIAPGDTQALPRIPVPGTAVAAALPTVALTLAPPLAPEPEVVAEVEREQVAPEPAAPKPVVAKPVAAKPPAEVPTATERPEPPADVESHERIYEEAMATIAALASTWSSAVQRTTGRHRAAA